MFGEVAALEISNSASVLIFLGNFWCVIWSLFLQSFQTEIFPVHETWYLEVLIPLFVTFSTLLKLLKLLSFTCILCLFNPVGDIFLILFRVNFLNCHWKGTSLSLEKKQILIKWIKYTFIVRTIWRPFCSILSVGSQCGNWGSVVFSKHCRLCSCKGILN